MDLQSKDNEQIDVTIYGNDAIDIPVPVPELEPVPEPVPVPVPVPEPVPVPVPETNTTSKSKSRSGKIRKKDAVQKFNEAIVQPEPEEVVIIAEPKEEEPPMVIEAKEPEPEPEVVIIAEPKEQEPPIVIEAKEPEPEPEVVIISQSKEPEPQPVDVLSEPKQEKEVVELLELIEKVLDTKNDPPVKEIVSLFIKYIQDSSLTDTFVVKLDDKMKSCFMFILETYPDDLDGFDKLIKLVFADCKIDMEDLPELVKLCSKMYNLVRKTNMDYKSAIECTRIILKFTIRVLINEKKIQIENSEIVGFLRGFDNLVDVCLDMLIESKTVEKGCNSFFKKLLCKKT